MEKKSIVLYLISDETAPNFVIRNAFQTHFNVLCDYDWKHMARQYGVDWMHRDFLEVLKTYQPDYCFMQIQNPAAMNVAIIAEMARHTRIIHWSGDVRNLSAWRRWTADIGEQIFLTLFSNETDAEYLNQIGIRAGYLQTGFDDVFYQRRHKISGWPDIVFVANNYDDFELSYYRAEIVLAMYQWFPGRFRVFGNGWEKFGISTESIAHTLEAECYNSCKLALSISNFNHKRYYSDRLLRIMGCGSCAISHSFPGLEKDFTPGYDILTFSHKEDLIEKCNYYLLCNEERNRIANNAFTTAHTKCSWDVRCKELIELLHPVNVPT